MALVKRLVLDVLKPHSPGVLEFANTIAQSGSDYTVTIRVLERDEKTETVSIAITGANIALDPIARVIADLGGSVHSVDEVDTVSDPDLRTG